MTATTCWVWGDRRGTQSRDLRWMHRYFSTSCWSSYRAGRVWIHKSENTQVMPSNTRQINSVDEVALSNSRLDYSNSLVNNTAIKDLSKLHRIHNCLAHFSPSLLLFKQLRWLPVVCQIKFKSVTVTYRTLSTQQLSLISLGSLDHPFLNNFGTFAV